ncbi:MAG TPA: MaoC family dehydratase [Actinomycetota bacterium]
MTVQTRAAAAVEAGMELPPLEIPITATLIVAGALASRDFQDVHHDAAVAKASGAKDLFMNILTTGGLVGRYVTDWTGPEALVRKMSIRLGVPNYPGDTMTLTGRVTTVAGSDVIVEVRGANALGDHVTGTVEVTLP